MKIKTLTLTLASLFACSALASAHCGKCEHKDGAGDKKEEAGEKKDAAKDGAKKEEAKLIADGDCKGGKCGDKKEGEADAPALLADGDCKGGKCGDKKDGGEAEAPALV